MACDSAFQELASHNGFIRDLDEQGFHIDYVGNYLVVYGIPYLDESCNLHFGDLFSALDLVDWVIDPPSDHQTFFRGGRPHNLLGQPIRLGGGEANISITNDVSANQSFSFKIMGLDGQLRPYVSIDEKITTYIDAITTPALAAFPDATPLRGIEVKVAAQGGPLKVPDTMSSRYNLNDVSAKLEGVKVAIVGLGGTGSYILDLISKTHVERITLFDDDKIHMHTLYRLPSVLLRSVGKLKVEVLAATYGEMHAGIDYVCERVSLENIEALLGYDFVFVSVDDAASRGLIAEYLTQQGVSFVDCGMGVVRSAGGLNAMVRVSYPNSSNFEALRASPYLPVIKTKEDEYRKQPQIAEFNAINAALAVIKFKQHFGLYEIIDQHDAILFESCSSEISYFDRES